MTFEDDLLALEAKVLADAAGDFLTAVAELRTMLATKAPGIERKLIALAIPRVETAARRGILDGFVLGGRWALYSLLPNVDKAVESDAQKAVQTAPAVLVKPLDGLDRGLAKAKHTAVLLLRNGADVDAALAPLFKVANTVKSTVETQINTASNTASLMVGEAVKSPMVWENERDACVYCLGLAGQVVDPGDDFPRADLYDDGGTSKRIVQAPPLHPHCRCRLAILNDLSYAEALQREAQRSILRGFSLESESNAVRVRAAKRLLNDPALLAPKSVKEYARRAVKNGKFPRGRDVPGGSPRLIIK